MEFESALRRRRSVRKYSSEPVPDSVIRQALEHALLAPNSSNLQTWEFHWIQNESLLEKLKEACLNQGAARTAPALIVAVSAVNKYDQNRRAILEHARTQLDKIPANASTYYEKLVPFVYGWRILAPIKWLMMNLIGIFRPITRSPWSSRQLEVVSIKSCALACENFMLSIADQGYDTCPMEGFDEVRVRRALGLRRSSKVVMVISVGKRVERGVWGEQFRVPFDWSVKIWK